MNKKVIGIALDKEIKEISDHASKCYKGKYNQSTIDPKPIILGPKTGLGFNLGNAVKYLSRYINESGEKSRNRLDLIKAIHYILFEMRRTGG